MSSSFYGLDAVWLDVASWGASGDSFLLTSDGKSAFASPTDDNDLEEVFWVLADDDFETKAVWNEADHPRDDRGRFANGSGGAFSLEVGSITPAPIVTTNTFEQVKKELTDINNEIEKIMGVKSRWSGTLLRLDRESLKASGRKDPGCSITLANDFFPDEKKATDHERVHRICTLLHESLHALAPKLHSYAGVGWEEAVVESLTRLHREQIFKTLHFNTTQEELENRDALSAYGLLVLSIEEIRRNLAKHGNQLASNPNAFYHKLLTLPAPEKKNFIQSEARTTMANASNEDRVTFQFMFTRTAKILSEYRYPDQPDAQKSSKKHTLAMTREELIHMMLSTRTREEVIATRQAIDEWMDEHPNDYGILEGGEMVANLAAIYGIRSPGEEENIKQQELLYARLEANPGLNIDAELQKLSTVRKDGNYDER